MNESSQAIRDIIESSSIFDKDYYLRTYSEAANFSADPLGYWLSTGVKLGHNPNPLFDTNWYVEANNLDISSDINPLGHFLTIGWRHFNDPGPHFSVEEYLNRNGDVAAANIEPLTHFLKYGRKENRPFFKSRHAEFFFPILPHGPAATHSNPEPGIKPSPAPIKRRVDIGSLNEKILSTLRAGRSSRSSNGAQHEHQKLELDFALVKLSLVDRPDDILGESLRSAEPAKWKQDALLMAGVTPVTEVDVDHIVPHEAPILDRYTNYRVKIAKALELDPSIAGTKTGAVKFSILMPIYKSPIIFLERAILSVVLQAYDNWELILVDDCSNSSDVDRLLAYYQSIDSRIVVIQLEENGGISAATNAGLKKATGDFIALIDHDDMITKDALLEIAEKLHSDDTIDWIYTDEAKINEDDIPDEIYTKTDWSPILLLNMMYTGHFTVYRKSIVDQVGGFRTKYDFSQDYDLALRIAELPVHVVHLEKCLYGWRMIPGSAAVGGKPTARQSNLAALQSAADRRNYPGIAIGLPTGNRVILSRTSEQPLVSIIIPSDNFDNILSTVQSVVTQSTYQRYEIVVVTNTKLMNKNKRHLNNYNIIFAPYDLPYNFSDKCNRGVEKSNGKFVILLNDDVRVVTPNWIEILLESALLPNVGAVAPKLLYESGHIQHAGMVTGVRRLVGTAFHAYPSNSMAHFNLPQSLREVSLLCGACIMLPRDVYENVGGFDAINTPISHSDVDLCFRLRERGMSCVYTPYATLTHIGHQSRESQDFDDVKEKVFKKDKSDIFLLKRWADYCAYDPYFPPSVRDMVYIDSQETYSLYPGKGPQDLKARSALIISHDLSQSGAPRVALDLVDTLKSAGYFVVVMTPQDGAMRAEMIDKGAHVIVDPLTLSQHDSVRDFASNFDVVIANTAVSWPIVSQVGKFTDVYWYIHETGLIDELANNPAFLDAFKFTKEVWTGSERSQQRLEYYGVEASIIEYGIDEQQIGMSGAAPRDNNAKMVISILGSVEARKGQDLAVLGFLKLPKEMREHCIVNIGGRILEEKFFRSIESAADGHKNIQYLGELEFESYLKVVQNSDVILCASRDDTLPLVSLHALAFGKTLVVSATTGTSKYIVDGFSGFTLHENSPEDICNILSKIIEKGESLKDVGRRAREVFEKTFSRRAFHDRILKSLNASKVVADTK